MKSAIKSLPIAVALIFAGCAARLDAPPVEVSATPAIEPLYSPERVHPGRLEYAPDRSTFAPILTERFPYPTQAQANEAYRRLLVTVPADRSYPVSIWLFGCKPGGLDGETARITRYHSPVVHCATDFLDASGRRLRRETTNFYYDQSAWAMEVVYPPTTTAPWIGRERSPKDRWWWVPGRARYE